eukprot:Skav209573  [mRNA]  locus=scaffold281:153023:156322:- [translate_table: standard]
MLLERAGCHPAENRLCASQAILHASPVSGLVIDDFFVLSTEDRHFAEESVYGAPSKSVEFLAKAKDEYAAKKILGSDDKEVRGSLKFKVVGAEVNSLPWLVDEGMVCLGAPAEKRMGLAMLSADVANLAYSTDSLHASLVGAWISALVYRKPMMAHMNSIFQVVDPDSHLPGEPKLCHLPRRAAEELLVLAVLSPYAASNLTAPFSKTIYASDSSTLKGGVVSAVVSNDVAEMAWKSSGKKHKNVKLESRVAALVRKADWFHEDEASAFAFNDEGQEEVSRPIGLWFQFIEVCGGAGVVTKELCRLGIVCGPVLDLTYSQKFDLTDDRLFEWLAFMCESGRLLSFLASPPCTTFSPAAYPALRSFAEPLGFPSTRCHPRVLLGNKLAFRSLGLMMVAKRTRVFGMTETPRRSKLRWTPQWCGLVEAGADEVFLASCMYGSPHQKEFCFLTVCMNAQNLARKCSRDHPHVVIQGKYTKDSAIYTPGLAEALALSFKKHLDSAASFADGLHVKSFGLEDLLSNELSTGLDWRVHSSWTWRGSSHINTLEVVSALRIFEEEASLGGDSRFVSLIDSNVALCSLARGRSSSDALRPLLKRASVLSLAYGLYHAGRFSPTRLNPGDHPTRDAPMPPKLATVIDGLSQAHLRWLSSLGGLRRWTSNWLRLSLLLCPSWIWFFADCSSSRRYGPAVLRPTHSALDFDSSLGFPGEGPPPVFRLCVGLLLTCWGAGAVGASHGDSLRKLQREGIELPEGRRVTETTSSIRSQLMVNFEKWIREQKLSFDEIFLGNPPNLDRINDVLVRYGRFLFSAGKPYYHYSETVNSISSRRPVLRRSLQGAWDLGAMWSSYEPVDHHQAMPPQVLLGVLSVALLWGWSREAAIFALAWGMLLRIGELVNAFRKDLIFPADVRHSIDHALLRIKEPKTRFRAARHQYSKLEYPDLLEVAWLGLGALNSYEKLWPFSPSTLRSRLNRILQRLGLPIAKGSSAKPLTLASFRPGGATYLISQTESSEMVRRRGRWASLRVMEVYLQEVASNTFLMDIPKASRELVLQAMEQFPVILRMSQGFSAAAFPERAWHFLFSQNPSDVETTGQMGQDGGNVK